MDKIIPSDVAPATRRITVLAQDPEVVIDGKVLTTQVEIPFESVFPGPRSSRVEVVDYDATADQFYGAFDIKVEDPYAKPLSPSKVKSDPAFHAQNVYGIVLSTILEFERALGRNLSWGFGRYSHQLKIFPHAFLEANAFYSQRDECLAFGYFPKSDKKKDTVFTCLSHDIIVHETAHALLDGLRSEFMRPSSIDQAAFHEGFADIIALLKVLKSEELISFAVKKEFPRNSSGTVEISKVMNAIQKGSFLFGLAEEFGKSLYGLGRNALREYAQVPPDPGLYHDPKYQESHIRGEILVGAVMNSFLAVWEKRLRGKLSTQTGTKIPRRVEIWRVAEEGATAAGHLLQMVIRAIDYLPPVNVDFGDFLSAILTADWQIFPEDKRSLYGYREKLLKGFADYGIKPASRGLDIEPGVWDPGVDNSTLKFNMSNMDAMRWNPEAMFKFIWENFETLGLVPDMFTRVNSVRPVWRIGPNGFVLRETVVEYYQLMNNASVNDLRSLGIKSPRWMTKNKTIKLVAGGTLIFDEFGRLKFHIHNRVVRSTLNKDGTKRLNSVAVFRPDSIQIKSFDQLHRSRAHGSTRNFQEEWV